MDLESSALVAQLGRVPDNLECFALLWVWFLDATYVKEISKAEH